MKYNRNINVKKYASVEDIYDSVNNDPKRPGFQIIFMDAGQKHSMMSDTAKAWYQHLKKNGYPLEAVTEKYPKINGYEYLTLIIKATPEEALALKITF